MKTKIVVAFQFLIFTENIVRIVDIRNIATSQNILDSIFYVGNITVSTSATSIIGKPFLQGIAEYKEISNLIQEQQQTNEDTKK